MMIVESLIALSVRQTNIFWTAIFLGGLELLRNVKRGRLGVEFHTPAIGDVVMGSWRYGCLYDPLSSKAWFEGLFI